MSKELPVCPQCGWHWVIPHSDCKPKAKPVADKLLRIAAAMGIDATRFGYGQGRVCFNFHENFRVKVRCHEDGTFSLDDVHLLADFDPDHAVDFLSPFFLLHRLVQLGQRIDDMEEEEYHRGVEKDLAE